MSEDKMRREDKMLYQIGEVAKRARVSVDTVRYYEKAGLLEKPVRSSGGFRLYTEKTVQQVGFIKKAQNFGLTLKEIRQINQASKRGLSNCCGYVNKVLQQKLGELETKIKDLHETRKNLQDLMKHWMPMQEAKKMDFAVCPQIEATAKEKRNDNKKEKKG